jgi:hypothetical protein
VYSFILYLIITIVTETLVALDLVRKIFKIDGDVLSTGLILSAGISANALTLPYVWFVFPYLFLSSFTLAVVIAEFFAFLAEAVFYKLFLKLTWKQALIISLIANLVSFILGQFLHYLFTGQ